MPGPDPQARVARRKLRPRKVSVSAAWLKQHLASRDLVVLDARSRSAYSCGRIPGSRNADLFHYFIPGTNARNLKLFHRDLEAKLGRLGLKAGDRIVVYESGLGMRAARVAWMLEYAGLKSPLLLEGGFKAWRKSMFPVEKKRRKVFPSKFTVHPNRDALATASQVRHLSQSHTGTVLDVRSKEEYEGSENRDCCPRPGRVPGALWLEWTSFLDGKGGFRSGRSMGRRLRSMGILPGNEIGIYCHRGARAAAAYYALRSMGYSRARNYVGSWHEWSSKKVLPAELGRVGS